MVDIDLKKGRFLKDEEIIKNKRKNRKYLKK